MEGQGSYSNTSPLNYYFGNGSDPAGLGLNCDHCVPDYSLCNMHSMHMLGESISSLVAQNFGTGQWVEGRRQHYINASEESITMSMGNVHDTNSLSVFQGASSGCLSNNIGSNVTYEGSRNIANIGAGLPLDSFGLGPAARHAPLTCGFNPAPISSGVAGYVLEENMEREGLSFNGRRLCSKRRAPEDSSEQIPLGGNLCFPHLAMDGFEVHVVAAQENSTSLTELNAGQVQHPDATAVMHDTSSMARTGFVLALEATSNTHQPSNVEGQSENFQRNIRLRRTVNHQDFAAGNPSTWNSRNASEQPPNQSAVLFPTLLAVPIPMVTPVQPILQVSNSLQTSQPSLGNRATTRMMPSASSITSGHSLNRQGSLHWAVNVRNNRSSMNRFVSEGRSSANMPTNPNLGMGNANVFENSVSTSRNGSIPGAQTLSYSNGFPEQDMARMYPQGVGYVIDWSESLRQHYYQQVNSVASPSVQDMELPARGGSLRSSQFVARSVPIRIAGREPGSIDEALPTIQAISALRRRIILLAEVHNALEIFRRGVGFRYEDFIMNMNNSTLYGVPEDPDSHEDLRLDIDNMSYEELLDLEERIGNVSTGLSNKDILAHLKLRKYQSATNGTPVEDEPCCICQEEYADGDDIGKLDCGHEFHFSCIKQWLVQKNCCPICKRIALIIRDRGL